MDRLKFLCVAVVFGLAISVASRADAQRVPVAGLISVVVGQGVPGAAISVNPAYPQVPFFSYPDVRRELRLNDQQYGDLNTRYERAWVRYNKERNVIDAKIPAEDRVRRERQLEVEFNKDLDPVLDATFTDPTVRQRYNQLHTQYRGYDAVLDPAVQKELNLTPEQVRTLQQHRSDWNKQMGGWRTDYDKNRAEVGKALGEARRQTRQRIDETLTPEQRNRWSNLYGSPYEFSADAYFPPASTTTLKPAIP